MKSDMYFVYVLRSVRDGRTYTDFTENLKKRLCDHSAGAVNATRHRRPLVVLFTEKFDTIKDAKKRECWWKSGAGRRVLRVYYYKNTRE